MSHYHQKLLTSVYALTTSDLIYLVCSIYSWGLQSSCDNAHRKTKKCQSASNREYHREDELFVPSSTTGLGTTLLDAYLQERQFSLQVFGSGKFNLQGKLSLLQICVKQPRSQAFPPSSFLDFAYCKQSNWIVGRPGYEGVCQARDQNYKLPFVPPPYQLSARDFSSLC